LTRAGGKGPTFAGRYRPIEGAALKNNFVSGVTAPQPLPGSTALAATPAA